MLSRYCLSRRAPSSFRGCLLSSERSRLITPFHTALKTQHSPLKVNTHHFLTTHARFKKWDSDEEVRKLERPVSELKKGRKVRKAGGQNWERDSSTNFLGVVAFVTIFWMFENGAQWILRKMGILRTPQSTPGAGNDERRSEEDDY